MNARTRPAIAAAVGLAAGVAAAVPFVIWWHRLPDPIADHWGADRATGRRGREDQCRHHPGGPGRGLLAGLGFGWIRVTVDRRGLRVHYGLLPWPVTRIPLDRVMHCAGIDVQPRGWGGYGYRGSRMVFRRSAVVLRAGDAIHLDLTNGSEFTVTVSDAAAGARLLSDLVARASAG